MLANLMQPFSIEASELLITVSALVHLHLIVHMMLVRFLLLNRIEHFRAVRARETTDFMSVDVVGGHHLLVKEPCATNIACKVSIMFIHVNLQRFEFSVNFKAERASKEGVIEFERYNVVIYITMHNFPVAFEMVNDFCQRVYSLAA